MGLFCICGSRTALNFGAGAKRRRPSRRQGRSFRVLFASLDLLVFPHCALPQDCYRHAVSKIPIVKRVRRIIRRVPTRTVRDWRRAFFSEDKALTLSVAVLTSYVGIRSAALPRLAAELSEWADAILATLYVSVAWFVICLLRSPLLLFRDDRRLGSWHGNRYVFREPVLMGSFRVKPTGAPEFFKLDCTFAEPDAFIYFRIDVDREIPQSLYSAMVASNMIVTSHFRPGAGSLQGGLLLDPNVGARLVVVMAPEAVARTFSVYCTDFALGEPNDRDGALGSETPSWVLKAHPRAKVED